MVAPTVLGPTNNGALTQDNTKTTLTTDLTVTFEDQDTADTLSYSFTSVANNLGSLTLTSSNTGTNGQITLGSVTYTYSVANAATQYLKAGETKTDTFVITAEDSNGQTASQTVTVVLTGTNDTPTITSAQSSGSFVEDGTQQFAAGTINFNDVDAADIHYVSATAAVSNTTSLGTFILGGVNEAFNASNGSVGWSYVFNNTAAQSLAQGQMVTETYNVLIEDGQGGSVVQPVVITITGTNDAPTVTAAAQSGVVTEAGFNVAGTPSATIQLTKLDTDANDVVSYDSTAMNLAGWTTTNNGSTFTKSGVYGAASLNTATDVVTYTLDNTKAATNALAAGASANDSFTVYVKDNKGGTASANANFNITGTNDAPSVAAALTASATKGGPALSLYLLAGASDVDSTGLNVDTVTYKVDGTTVASIPAGLTLSGNTLQVNPNDAAFNNLTTGKSTVIQVSYQVTDSAGAYVTQTETITINGPAPATQPNINHAPTVTAAAQSVVVTEAGFNMPGASSATIELTKADTDAGDTATYDSIALGLAGWTATNNGSTFTKSGVYGEASLDANSGVVTYTLDNTKAATNALAAGAIANDSFTVYVKDNNGGTASTNASFAITGSNDAPTVAGSLSITATRGDAAFKLDLLASASDVDAGDELSVINVKYFINDSQTPVTSTPTYVKLTNNTLEVDPRDAVFSNLKTNETFKIVAMYDVKDKAGLIVSQTETITIKGSGTAPTGGNHAPVVLGPLTTSVNKGDAAFNLNLLYGASDPDATSGDRIQVQNLHYSINGNPSDGSTPSYLQWNGSTLRVDPTDTTFSKLYSGQQFTIVATYDIQDNFGATTVQSETITINGTGSAPTVTPISSSPIVNTPMPADTIANSSPYGGVSIIDYGKGAKIGSTLLANISKLVDPDGINAASYQYQWTRDHVAIQNKTQSSYQVQTADKGHYIGVEVTFIDGANHTEKVASYDLYAYL